jgi:biopolymer transport protein ExbD
MKFQRNAKVFRGQLDAAPFAAVFFVLLLFMAFNSSLVFTPGVRLELPEAGNLPGPAGPTFVVAVDARGRLYHNNELLTEPELRKRLAAAVEQAQKARERLALVMQADKTVSLEVVISLSELARSAGVREVWQATRPPYAGGATNGGGERATTDEGKARPQ